MLPLRRVLRLWVWLGKHPPPLGALLGVHGIGASARGRLVGAGDCIGSEDAVDAVIAGSRKVDELIGGKANRTTHHAPVARCFVGCACMVR